MENCLFQARFLHLHTIEATNSKGKKIVWEFTARNHDITSQGVDVIPSLGNQVLVNVERRFPVGGKVLSFPGGICDTDNVLSEALKELREETGYSATNDKVTCISPLLYIDPWKSKEKTQFLSVDLDEAEKIEPELEDLEDIDTIFIDKENMCENIEKISNEKGVKIDCRMFSYALGRMYGDKLKKS